MKETILKVTALGILGVASFMFRSEARSLRGQGTTAAPAQATPQEKTVGQVFKNIQLLNEMPQTQLYPTMRFMAASLGVQCGFCHVIKTGQLDNAADQKPEKQTARVMIGMVLKINQTLAQGNPEVSCYTCHRGRALPQGFPTLPLPLLSSRSLIAGGASASGVPEASSRTAPNSTVALPSADSILNKYITAIGGRTNVDLIHTCVIKGTTTTSSGQLAAYEAEQVSPDKGHESFPIQGRTFERVINGAKGWLKNGEGVQELIGQQLADQKLSFPLFAILKLKDQYSSARVSAEEKIDDRDVYVVNAIRSDNKRESLYFDVENGLLRRRISYLRGPIGVIPQQTDFEDYRQVEALQLPFTIRVSFVDAETPPITRKFAEIRLNVPVSDSKFDKPQAPKEPAP